MRERGIIHPDLLKLHEAYSRWQSRLDGPQVNQDRDTLIFPDRQMSIGDAYNIIAPAVKAGSNVVLLLPEDPRGLEASRKIARWLVRVGFTSTEFDRKVLPQNGHQKFEGGFCLRYVYIS